MDYINTSKEIEEKRVFSTIEMNSDSEDKTDEDSEYNDDKTDEDEDNLCKFCKTDFKTHEDLSQHYMHSNTCSDLYWAQEEVLPWSKCPGCKLAYSKILLHLRKDSTCRSSVTEEEYKKLVDRSKLHRRTQNRKNQSKRRKEKSEADPELEKTELLKNREYKKLQREMNPKEFKEKQNFWKKKSRENARKADIEEEKAKQNDCKARSRTL